jgi:hypothetical protein
MNKIITINFFARDKTRWGIEYIPWREIERVMPKEMKRGFISSLIGTKQTNKDGVEISLLNNFLKDYYNLKE